MRGNFNLRGQNRFKSTLGVAVRVAVGAVVVWAPWGTPGPGKMVPTLFFFVLPEIHAPKVGPKIDSLLILHPHGFFYTLRVNESQIGAYLCPASNIGYLYSSR